MGNINSRLIIDVGMSEGHDSDFYLRKGFRVIGVEADPTVVSQLTDRFKPEIEGGRLCIINRAAWSQSGHSLTFWRNMAVQGHSSLDRERGFGRKEPIKVDSVAWSELRTIAGTPYYLKMDIEGGEVAFLKSMAGSPEMPTYISTECHTFDPIEAMFQLGYRKFKLVNQTILHCFPMPDPPLEGDCVTSPDWAHASGAFGKELPGHQWQDFQGIARQFDMIRQLREAGGVFQSWVWFDCHARINDE